MGGQCQWVDEETFCRSFIALVELGGVLPPVADDIALPRRIC
jgi:hypothetical protein